MMNLSRTWKKIPSAENKSSNLSWLKSEEWQPRSATPNVSMYTNSCMKSHSKCPSRCHRWKRKKKAIKIKMKWRNSQMKRIKRTLRIICETTTQLYILYNLYLLCELRESLIIITMNRIFFGDLNLFLQLDNPLLQLLYLPLILLIFRDDI